MKLSEFSVYKWRRKYRDVLYACFCIYFVTVTPRSELALNSKKLTTDSGVDKQIFFLFAVKSFLKSGSVQALWRQTSSLS